MVVGKIELQEMDNNLRLLSYRGPWDYARHRGTETIGGLVKRLQNIVQGESTGRVSGSRQVVAVFHGFSEGLRGAECSGNISSRAQSSDYLHSFRLRSRSECLEKRIQFCFFPGGYCR